jgi:hypothetical protein
MEDEAISTNTAQPEVVLELAKNVLQVKHIDGPFGGEARCLMLVVTNAVVVMSAQSFEVIKTIDCPSINDNHVVDCAFDAAHQYVPFEQRIVIDA